MNLPAPIRMDEFTITKRPTLAGGTEIGWNVDKNGQPFAYIWTFKNTKTETFGFSAKLVANPNVWITGLAKYETAEEWVRGQ